VRCKILNLYCGLGGNRKNWPDDDIEVTAVEYNADIAKIYQDFFPNDTVIVSDAHDYLLQHFKEYDFIWSSPPCPTHSLARTMAVFTGQNKAVYPDMKLYQEIILLQRFHKKGSFYCVENVKPYYDPLISAQECGRHLFWTNFYLQDFKNNPAHEASVKEMQKIKGIDISAYDNIDKKKCLRNCVDPKLGKHIYDCAFKNIQLSLI